MRKLYAVFLGALDVYCGLLALLMFLVVVLGVAFRYVVGSSLSWYDEFAEFVLVWLTMYGSVLALARGQHIGFETFVEMLPAPLRRVSEVVSTLCILAFSGIMLVSGWALVQAMAAETAVSIPEIKMGWIYSVLPITGGLMVLVGLVNLGTLLTRGPLPLAKGMEEGQ
jgi:TRAP-type C4-dicarboxylate transport system permease small subunit